MSTTHPPLHLATPSHSASHLAFQQTRRALGAALAWLSTLPHDSREPFPSKDTDLASYGVSWSTDLLHETELARELATSRLRRRAGVAVAPDGSPLPVSPAPTEGALDTPAVALPATMGVS